jgi:hypothetical protein
MIRLTFGLMAALLAVVPVPAQAGDPDTGEGAVVTRGSQVPTDSTARKVRRKPQVRAYIAPRGGYSYSYSDAALGFRNDSVWRERQTWQRQSQPFDNDFFYDSGVTRHNESPY